MSRTSPASQPADLLPVVIIGAGVGGLSAAIHLAAAGRRVVVVEQNSQVGGKMGELRAGGFRWDTGPSVITMRHVLEELFAVAGTRLEDELDLRPVEPLTRYIYPDGTILDASSSVTRMAEQIAGLDRRDVVGYRRFLSYAERLHRITGPVFIYDEPPTWRSFLRVSPLDMLRVDGLRSMDRAIKRFVRSPQLRQLLGRFATYVGASPFSAPATLNVIAHVELGGGVWYPRGGIYAIAEALRRVAERLGVEIRTGCAVSGIDVGEGRARGVVLADGSALQAVAVVANVDVATVYERLLPRGSTSGSRLRRLTNVQPSCSGLILLLGVEGQFEQLAHHTILFSADYRREFEDIFDRGVPPADPTIYVAVTSKTDPEHAPPGCENWFVMVNAPALGPAWSWKDNTAGYKEHVLERLAARGFDLRGRIREEHILTPVELERLTGARRGALYGASSNSRLAAFRRPHNRAPDIAGLYFTGGTTHPGGGVPMVALSGRAAARLLLRDLALRGRPARSTPGASQSAQPQDGR